MIYLISIRRWSRLVISNMSRTWAIDDLYSNLEGAIEDRRLFDGVNVVSDGVSVVSDGVNVVSDGVSVVSDGVNVVSDDDKCVLTDISHSFSFSPHCSYWTCRTVMVGTPLTRQSEEGVSWNWLTPLKCLVCALTEQNNNYYYELLCALVPLGQVTSWWIIPTWSALLQLCKLWNTLQTSSQTTGQKKSGWPYWLYCKLRVSYHDCTVIEIFSMSRQCLLRGLRYILSIQKPDGSWEG